MTPNQKLKTLESLAAEACRRIKKLREENVRLQAEVRGLRERAGKLEADHKDGRRADEKLARARTKIEKLIAFIEKLERRTGPDKRPAAAPALVAEPSAAYQAAPEPPTAEAAPQPVSESAAAEPAGKPKTLKRRQKVAVGADDQREFPFGGDR